MDDLGAMLSQFLSSQEGQQQLNAVASALGIQGGGAAQAAPAPAPAPAPSGGQLDIASLLSGLQSSIPPAASPTPQPASGGGIDMAQLGQILSSLNTSAQPQQPAQQGGGLDLSALAGLFGGQGTGQTAPSPPSQLPPPGLDMGAIMGLQRAFSAFGQDRNTALLLALKPSLSLERQKKVDDAVRILQLMKLLPLVKETGLFGDMSWLGGDRR